MKYWINSLLAISQTKSKCLVFSIDLFVFSVFKWDDFDMTFHTSISSSLLLAVLLVLLECGVFSCVNRSGLSRSDSSSDTSYHGRSDT